MELRQVALNIINFFECFTKSCLSSLSKLENPKVWSKKTLGLWKLPSSDCKQLVGGPPKSKVPLEYSWGNTKHKNPVTTKLA